MLKAGFSVNKKAVDYPVRIFKKHNHLRSLKTKGSRAERKRKPEPVGLIGSDWIINGSN